MTINQAIKFLKGLGFVINEPLTYRHYEVRAPSNVRHWSLKERELVMLAEGIQWAREGNFNREF